MNRTATALTASLAAVLALGLTGTASAATPPTAACTQATVALTNSQTSLAEAKATDKTQQNNVAAVKAHRQGRIDAGDVAGVGQDNVKLGSLTAYANTSDSAVAGFQAQVNRDRKAKTAACS